MTIHAFGVAALAAGLVFSVAATSPSGAAQAQGPRKLDVSFDQGRVTIDAENVTIREILLEWARKGGSRIVNAEKLAGPVLPSVAFTNEPEVLVLRSLLRDVPGYGLAPRITGVDGQSTIEAVFVLATRSVPVSSAAAPPPQAAPPAAPQVSPYQPQDFQPPPAPQSPPLPIQGDLPPTTPGGNQPANPNLRTGPGGAVTSVIPGVVIPGPATPPAGGRGRGGGRR